MFTGSGYRAVFFVAPEVLDNFLTEILKTADRSKEFLDSFIYNPREVIEIMNALKEKVGSNSKNLMTFMYSSPYNRAYSEYLKSKFENEKCIESERVYFKVLGTRFILIK